MVTSPDRSTWPAELTEARQLRTQLGHLSKRRSLVARGAPITVRVSAQPRPATGHRRETAIAPSPRARIVAAALGRLDDWMHNSSTIDTGGVGMGCRV